MKVELDDTIGVGLAAFGMSGRVFHAPLLKNNPHFRIRRVMERSNNEANRFLPGIPVSPSFDELLSDQSIQVIVVNTPDSSHYALAKESLEAGKHVVVEKPITQTSAQAEELIGLAGRARRVLTVFQNRRWDGDLLTVQKLLREGVLGRLVDYEAHWDRYRNFIQQGTWKERTDSGTGLLQNLGSHLIDQALVIFGLPEAVTAHLRVVRTGGSVTDWFHIRLHYPSVGVVLSSSYLAREPSPRFVLHGTLGSFVKHGMDPQEQALAGGGVPGSEGWGTEPEAAWGTLTTEGTPEKRKVETLPGNYMAFYNNLYDCIARSGEIAVKPEEATDVIRIIEAAQKSDTEGRTVRLFRS
jgi:scyllo-inositol 2-dehydrogenase (NADP+)